MDMNTIVQEIRIHKSNIREVDQRAIAELQAHLERLEAEKIKELWRVK